MKNPQVQPDDLRSRLNSFDLPKPVIGGLIAALAAVGGWSIYSSLPSRESGAVVSENQPVSSEMRWLQGKVQETGGDLRRLSAADRERADKIARATTGMGADALFANPKTNAPVLNEGERQAQIARRNWERSRKSSEIAARQPQQNTSAGR